MRKFLNEIVKNVDKALDENDKRLEAVLGKDVWKKMRVRLRVFEGIDDERIYQDGLEKFRSKASDKTVPAEILLMQEYLNKAVTDFAANYGDQPALHQIRKVVALGVRCLENHGCPEREDDI